MTKYRTIVVPRRYMWHDDTLSPPHSGDALPPDGALLVEARFYDEEDTRADFWAWKSVNRDKWLENWAREWDHAIEEFEKRAKDAAAEKDWPTHDVYLAAASYLRDDPEEKAAA